MRIRVALVLGCAPALIGLAALPAGGGAATPAVPQTRITFGPEGWTNISSPTFAYESNDPEATFECRLDAAPFEPCNLVEEEATLGPPNYEPLPDGRHVFEVRAVNQAGVADPTPARAVFHVDTEYPVAEYTGGPFGVTHLRRPKFRIRVSGQTSFSCRVLGKGVRIKVRSCSGPRSFRPPRPLPDGHYKLTIHASNRAGNETENFAYFTVRTAPRHRAVR